MKNMKEEMSPLHRGKKRFTGLLKRFRMPRIRKWNEECNWVVILQKLNVDAPILSGVMFNVGHITTAV